MNETFFIIKSSSRAETVCLRTSLSSISCRVNLRLWTVRWCVVLNCVMILSPFLFRKDAPVSSDKGGNGGSTETPFISKRI